MQAADAPDVPYDGDAISDKLDDAFSELFGRDCAALWAATGTAANCLALTTMVEPHGGLICHEGAHIEGDECGAPGFYLHGAKLLPCGGDHGKLTVESVAARLDAIRPDVHRVKAHAISLTQATEAGCVYSFEEMAALTGLARERGLKVHMDGARFANATAFLDCSPAQACGDIDALSFGFIKNGGLGAEAIVLFDPEQAELVRMRRKRAGHLQCKGRFLAAQLLAMLEGDLWLSNARASNKAAALIAAGAGDRLLHPVEANQVFCRCSPAEREALRAQGFGFYDWNDEVARFVAAWHTKAEDAEALGHAIAAL